MCIATCTSRSSCWSVRNPGIPRHQHWSNLVAKECESITIKPGPLHYHVVGHSSSIITSLASHELGPKGIHAEVWQPHRGAQHNHYANSCSSIAPCWGTCIASNEGILKPGCVSDPSLRHQTPPWPYTPLLQPHSDATPSLWHADVAGSTGRGPPVSGAAA